MSDLRKPAPETYAAINDRLTGQPLHRAADNLVVGVVGEQVWVELLAPGLRLRLELTQDEVDDLAQTATIAAAQLRQLMQERDRKDG